jgi:hypothetical protein
MKAYHINVCIYNFKLIIMYFLIILRYWILRLVFPLYKLLVHRVTGLCEIERAIVRSDYQ